MKLVASLISVVVLNVVGFGKIPQTECNLSEKLSKSQIKALMKVKSDKTYDLLTWATKDKNQGFNEFAINVLKSPRDGQFVIFFGEYHMKNSLAAERGKAFVKQFPLRFYEGVPSEEAKEVYKSNPEVFTSRENFWLKVVAGFRFSGSSIQFAQGSGLTIGMGEKNTVYRNAKPLPDYSNTKVETADEVLIVLEKFTNEASVNLPLEIGPYLKPSMEDSYVIVARNERMYNNISTYLNGLVRTITPVVMVGAAHNPGLMELLYKNHCYEQCKGF